MIHKNTAQGKPSLKELKAMVVDDSKTILRSAEIYLQKLGCKVMTAQDGFESLALIADFKPDIIFLDIMMPRLDGYQTCAIIKSNTDFANIPVIMLSSKNNLFDKARGRLAGSEEYITKPFTENDLRDAIEPYTKGEESASSEDDDIAIPTAPSLDKPSEPKADGGARIQFAQPKASFDDDIAEAEVVEDPIIDMGFQAPPLNTEKKKESDKPTISLLDIDLTK